jgi:phosphoglycerate dehydrogenase-like enzyme
MEPGLQGRLFSPGARRRLGRILDIDHESVITSFDEADPALLERVEVLVTGWGAPVIGALDLERMPRLRAVFHAAGTVKGHLHPEVWDRGILVTTAALANAYPVAEYALAMILLAGKDVFGIAADYTDDDALEVSRRRPVIGNYRRTVGVIGASTIGRRVIELLGSFDFEVLLYDPIISDLDPILRGARRVSLDELFERSTIVSVHAPLLPETRGMVGADELARMAPGSTLINTARAPIVDQAALTAALAAGRLKAILDVTDPEPLPLGHPLRSAPGVLITPHVAGALGNELFRLGESVVREAELFSENRAAAFPVQKDDLAAMA